MKTTKPPLPSYYSCFVILLTSCGSNTTKTQETKASSTKNQVTMTCDQQLLQENTMSVLVPKADRALYLLSNVVTDCLKEILQTPS